MSDYIPQSRNQTDQSLFSTIDSSASNQATSDSFFQLDPDWSSTIQYKQPIPSPILSSGQMSHKVSDIDSNIGNRQVGVVNPSRLMDANKKYDTLIENSRSNILSIISLLNEYVISHPFIVVRRQAQVNNRSTIFHLTPFTVIPFMLKLQRTQGISTFFKGLPSVLINYVLLIGIESFLYNLLQFPIEYDFGSFANLFSIRLLKHLTLKSLSILVVTPFICSSSIETVQSWIVGESPYPLEHIKEGLSRIIHFRKDRKLPFYRLIGPSILYHLCYYILFSLIRQTIIHFYYNRENQCQEPRTHFKLTESHFFDEPSNLVVDESISKIPDRNESNEMMKELKSSLFAHMFTDILTYPFQNILYRMFLQGTRTLIDNVDGRTAVIPLITNYDSAMDCYQSILHCEGSSGLFKGFGALILQYSIQASIIQITNYCIDLILNG